MSVKLERSLLFLLFSFLVLSPAISQEQEDQSATELLLLYYDNIFGDDERLINGHFYYGPAKGSIQGHPYYFDESWKNGIIETADARFDGLQVKYDICLNRIILKYTSTDNAFYQIGLNSGNITRVKVANSEFIPLPGTNDSIDIPFSELISNGPVQYLVTRNKSLQITNSSGSTDYEYKEYVKQYLFYNDMLLSFRSKKMLYKTFPEIKNQLRRYVRRNNLYLIRNRIDDRGKLIDYCNALLSGNNE